MLICIFFSFQLLDTHVDEVSYTPDTEIHSTTAQIDATDIPDVHGAATDLDSTQPKASLFMDTIDLFHIMDQASNQMLKSAEALNLQKQKKRRIIGHLIARVKLQELTQMDGEAIFEKYHAKD